MQKTIDEWQFEQSSTDFNRLMQKRIYRVLLVCSRYDYFILEEDGRIEEQIFNEYMALNMRYPPAVIQTDSADEAFKILEDEEIDLVILMLNIGESEPFSLAREIKNIYPGKPIVLLTPFLREVSAHLKHEDLSAIDYTFCWLGNADLLVAIIKLIEDKMNAANDIVNNGVQALLLVEDSVRYISHILPVLYKIIIWQSQQFAQEGLNEHLKMLRLRGRPKILLTKTLDEAKQIYNQYGDHLLGVISDVSFNKNRNEISFEGFELCKYVREKDPFLAFLFQSSDKSNAERAGLLNAGFLWKQSKSLSHEMKQYIIENFGFGDLVFTNPKGKADSLRIHDLADLQKFIFDISDEAFLYHARRNEISRWLNARALFSIGSLFRDLQIEDFETLNQARSCIFDAIAIYRINNCKGVIASFNKNDFNEYLTFCRIGEGSLGGKGRGLAFLDSLIRRHNLFEKFEKTQIIIPRTVVIATDLFDEFMEQNDLYKIASSESDDKKILDKFLKASLPNRLYHDLQNYVKKIQNPVAVRSSSKLEDSHFMPFAGVYRTYMVPHSKDGKRMTEMLCDAIKCVYASVYYKESKAYMTSTSSVIDEEKMAIILEEVCGKAYQNRFYPAMSGVARSVNYYPVSPETAGDGVVNIAYGLGKYLVDGGSGMRFCPKYPKKVLQLSVPELALKESQKYFYALNTDERAWKPLDDDKVNLLKCTISEAKNDGVFQFCASKFDLNNQIVSDGSVERGIDIITFSKVLNYNLFPLPEIIKTLFDIGSKEMNTAIEIEFAVDMDKTPDEKFVFYLLQLRPMVMIKHQVNVTIEEAKSKDVLLYSEMALGNGLFENVKHFVVVKPEAFNSVNSVAIAMEIERLNARMMEEKLQYILAGPGRWGSSDLSLGVPVKWAQIINAAMIVEFENSQFYIEPSQGTHFFQNLTTMGTAYLTVTDNPALIMQRAAENAEDIVYESGFIKVFRFPKELICKVDGRANKGIVMV